ncbi:MAG: glycoside hydrolase family 99-like domain-containing protein [Opitutaceae bacterium]|jgi:hypothetical protein
MKQRPQIAAYYFPNYHEDARNALVHGRGWSEWRLLPAATPRWPGHHQPNLPAGGFTDEADPATMARKIEAAADHGVDAFIFDWYWYNDGPFLQRGLDEGYLGATNRERVKFALMWANHDWTDIHPQKLGETPRLLYPGSVTRETFDRIVDHAITHYFSSPSYWLIDRRPYFSIYDLRSLVDGLGGVEPAIAALRHFRERTRAAGHPDLHLNLVLWQHGILAGEKTMDLTPELITRFGFDSITSYVWVHHFPPATFPTAPYLDTLQSMLGYTRDMATRFPSLPYYPNVTMGWDPSPRTVQSDTYENRGYPFMGTYADNTPDNFRHALQSMRSWLEGRPATDRILTINAWNEWTEGSYLEPDLVNGTAYLEAIRDTFGPNVT